MPIRKKISAPALGVIGRLQDAGYQALLVGGAVRDILLKQRPKDYDISTDATPEQVKAVFGRDARIIGRRFRLVHVRRGRQVFEVSTFRREPTMEERKGRDDDSGPMVWRDNVYGTLEDDARRRDFTVNAIYYDPFREDEPVIDYVGGLADLDAQVVRSIGDAERRLAEDPVRMLRACKLAGQYQFTLEPDLKAAVTALAERVSLCSQARLLEELFKVLKKPYAKPTFEACQELGLLETFLPELAADWDTEWGQQALSLLDTRDRMLADDEIYASRTTGIATVMLPFVESEFGDSKDGPLWRNYNGIDRQLQERVRHFLSPYQVPRYVVACIRDILLLQPKFHYSRRGPAASHRQYRRGQDVYRTLRNSGALKRSRNAVK